MTESKSGASETTGVRQEIQDLRKNMEVQAATQAGANATQAAHMRGPGRRWSLAAPDSSSACSLPLPSRQLPAPNDVPESDAPIAESDDEYANHDDDAPSDADKARDEQAKQEESGRENPT
jgi:hypothetical protein